MFETKVFVVKKYLFALLILTLLQAHSCRKDPRCTSVSHYGLTIKNNHIKKINYAFYWNYPDTIITEKYSPVGYSFPALKTGDSVIRGSGRIACWESIFIDKPKEWIYFFDQDSLEQIPWDTIKATNRGILERREITLDYLRQNNFVITYP
jgi:hypothetical protein